VECLECPLRSRYSTGETLENFTSVSFPGREVDKDRAIEDNLAPWEWGGVVFPSLTLVSDLG